MQSDTSPQQLPRAFFHFLLDEYTNTEFGNHTNTAISQWKDLCNCERTTLGIGTTRPVEVLSKHAFQLLEDGTRCIEEMCKPMQSDLQRIKDTPSQSQGKQWLPDLFSKDDMLTEKYTSHEMQQFPKPMSTEKYVSHERQQTHLANLLVKRYVRAWMVNGDNDTSRKYQKFACFAGVAEHAMILYYNLPDRRVTLMNSGLGVHNHPSLEVDLGVTKTTLHQLIVEMETVDQEGWVSLLAENCKFVLARAFSFFRYTKTESLYDSVFTPLLKRHAKAYEENDKQMRRRFVYQDQSSGSCTFYSIQLLFRYLTQDTGVLLFTELQRVMLENVTQLWVAFCARSPRFLGLKTAPYEMGNFGLAHALFTKSNVVLHTLDEYCQRHQYDTEVQHDFWSSMRDLSYKHLTNWSPGNWLNGNETKPTTSAAADAVPKLTLSEADLEFTLSDSVSPFSSSSSSTHSSRLWKDFLIAQNTHISLFVYALYATGFQPHKDGRLDHIEAAVDSRFQAHMAPKTIVEHQFPSFVNLGVVCAADDTDTEEDYLVIEGSVLTLPELEYLLWCFLETAIVVESGTDANNAIFHFADDAALQSTFFIIEQMIRRITKSGLENNVCIMQLTFILLSINEALPLEKRVIDPTDTTPIEERDDATFRQFREWLRVNFTTYFPSRTPGWTRVWTHIVRMYGKYAEFLDLHDKFYQSWIPYTRKTTEASVDFPFLTQRFFLPVRTKEAWRDQPEDFRRFYSELVENENGRGLAPSSRLRWMFLLNPNGCITNKAEKSRSGAERVGPPTESVIPLPPQMTLSIEQTHIDGDCVSFVATEDTEGNRFNVHAFEYTDSCEPYEGYDNAKEEKPVGWACIPLLSGSGGWSGPFKMPLLPAVLTLLCNNEIDALHTMFSQNVDYPLLWFDGAFRIPCAVERKQTETLVGSEDCESVGCSFMDIVDVMLSRDQNKCLKHVLAQFRSGNIFFDYARSIKTTSFALFLLSLVSSFSIEVAWMGEDLAEWESVVCTPLCDWFRQNPVFTVSGGIWGQGRERIVKLAQTGLTLASSWIPFFGYVKAKQSGQTQIDPRYSILLLDQHTIEESERKVRVRPKFTTMSHHLVRIVHDGYHATKTSAAAQSVIKTHFATIVSQDRISVLSDRKRKNKDVIVHHALGDRDFRVMEFLAEITGIASGLPTIWWTKTTKRTRMNTDTGSYISQLPGVPDATLEFHRVITQHKYRIRLTIVASKRTFVLVDPKYNHLVPEMVCFSNKMGLSTPSSMLVFCTIPSTALRPKYVVYFTFAKVALQVYVSSDRRLVISSLDGEWTSESVPPGFRYWEDGIRGAIVMRLRQSSDIQCRLFSLFEPAHRSTDKAAKEADPYSSRSELLYLGEKQIVRLPHSVFPPMWTWMSISPSSLSLDVTPNQVVPFLLYQLAAADSGRFDVIHLLRNQSLFFYSHHTSTDSTRHVTIYDDEGHRTPHPLSFLEHFPTKRRTSPYWRALVNITGKYKEAYAFSFLPRKFTTHNMSQVEQGEFDDEWNGIRVHTSDYDAYTTASELQFISIQENRQKWLLDPFSTFLSFYTTQQGSYYPMLLRQVAGRESEFYQGVRTAAIVLVEMCFGNLITVDQARYFHLLSSVLRSNSSSNANNTTNGNVNGPGSEWIQCFQSIMGSGKSSVITPLLVFEFQAYQNRNIFLTMPDTLIPQSIDTFSRYFISALPKLSFCHLDAHNKRGYTTAEILLESVPTKSCGVVFASDVSLKSLMLIVSEKKCLKDESALIHTTFHTRGLMIVDEVDKITNPLTSELNFPTVQLTPLVDRSRIVAALLDIVCLFHTHWADIPAMSSPTESLRFVMSTVRSALLRKRSAFSPDTHEALEYYYNTLANGTIGNSSLVSNRIAPSFFENSSGNENAPTDKGDDAEKMILRQANMVLHVHQVIVSLAQALTMLQNKDFGLASSNSDSDEASFLFAIPYSDADTPLIGSEFSNVMLKFTLTTLSYLRAAQMRDTDRASLKKLIQNFYSQQCNSNWTIFVQNVFMESLVLPYIKSLPTYESADVDVDWMPFIKIDRLLDHAWNENRAVLVKYYMSQYIMRKHSATHTSQYSCSALDMFHEGFCPKRVGFSGTLNMMTPVYAMSLQQAAPVRLDPADWIHPDVASMKRSRRAFYTGDHSWVMQMQQDKPNIVDRVLATIINDTVCYDAFIDAGAFFMSVTPFEVAQKVYARLRSRKEKDPQDRSRRVLFIDPLQHAWQELSEDGTKACAARPVSSPRELLFCYYDQKHTVGFDLKNQPAKMKGVCSIHYFNQWTGVVQAMFRLRQLHKQHSIDFCIHPSIGLDPEAPQRQLILDLIQYLENNERRSKTEAHSTLCVQNAKMLCRFSPGDRGKMVIANFVEQLISDTIAAFPTMPTDLAQLEVRTAQQDQFLSTEIQTQATSLVQQQQQNKPSSSGMRLLSALASIHREWRSGHGRASFVSTDVQQNTAQEFHVRKETKSNMSFRDTGEYMIESSVRTIDFAFTLSDYMSPNRWKHMSKCLGVEYPYSYMKLKTIPAFLAAITHIQDARFTVDMTSISYRALLQMMPAEATQYLRPIPVQSDSTYFQGISALCYARYRVDQVAENDDDDDVGTVKYLLLTWVELAQMIMRLRSDTARKGNTITTKYRGLELIDKNGFNVLTGAFTIPFHPVEPWLRLMLGDHISMRRRFLLLCQDVTPSMATFVQHCIEHTIFRASLGASFCTFVTENSPHLGRALRSRFALGAIPAATVAENRFMCAVFGMNTAGVTDKDISRSVINIQRIVQTWLAGG